MKNLKQIIAYLKKHDLLLTTAESCTGGEIIHLLATMEGSGECVDVGYVVYSEVAKKRILGVKAKTIRKFTLTSEEVAREMVTGALCQSGANVVIATTGVAGKEPMDGISPGTICLGWGFKKNKKLMLFSETQHFSGTRARILKQASEYALHKMVTYHKIITAM